MINQVAQLKEERAENFTVKQMERMRKQLEKKLDKLNDQSRKDDVVTFEQLGVDSLMVDEAHAFKNLAVLSKMRNVAGISQTESQRASDLYMKCRYLDEITGSRGVVFATGTPISNSMAELFTMQRYLQRETLEQHGLSSFDAWASTFGETVTAVELAPEGTGYRTKTRFSKFYNLPELMSMFKQVADVQTADMLNLPVPKLVGGKPINVALPPSPQQKQMVADLADRAEEIRAGNVDPTEDNMLKVTNDGRKLALDQRLIDPNLPENPNDKVHACAENVYRIWNDTKEKRLTQLVFCDLSTPKPDGFNVYDDLRNLLISMGIPENEVQFIHSANTEVKKAELFAKVRSGDVRVLMGSTGKMGAGTNVQRLLVATHHLDCGWKPSDIEQRNGRMIRQGNTNAEVYEYLCDEHNYYITPAYSDEGWYVEKTTFADNRQAAGEQIDKTSYSANYHIHADNALAESQDQVAKGNVEISKIVSSSGQSNGLELEGAGFTFFLVSDLSKLKQFEQTRSGSYTLQSILDAYIDKTYDNEHPKWDFSAETQAIARTYEVNVDEIAAYNKTLTAAGENKNGKGDGWQPTGSANEYQLAEIFSNDTGNIRVQGLPYGTYLVVETTVPHDLFQAEPFIVTVDPEQDNNPWGAMATPKDSVMTGSDSYQKFTVLDEEIEVYLRITKVDEETGKPVLLPGTAFQIYYLDDDGNYRMENGAPKLVRMTDTVNGNLPKNVTTFYTNAEGVLTLPEKLPLGKYRIVETTAPNGYYNAWADDASHYVDFTITTDRIYQATGDKNENGMDTLVIGEKYSNHETLGKLTIRKTGEVLTGWQSEPGGIDPLMTGEAENGNFTYETRPLAGAEYTITAAEDIYTQDRQLDNYGNRTLWYAKGDVVAVVTTGGGTADTAVFAPARTAATYDFLSVIHDGTIGEVSVTLPLGSYHIAETKPPYGYAGTDADFDVTLAWDNQTQEIVAADAVEFHNEREKAKVGIYKTDLESGKYLAGAVFNLYTADDIYDADGSLVFAAGELVATSPETNADGTTYFDCDIPIRGEQYGSSTHKDAATNSGKYIIEEIRAPLGYYVNEEPMEVTFTYDGQTVRILESTCTDKPTEMWVSKRDLTNDEELPGATLTIQDMDGNIVESWVSTDTPHRVTGLHLGDAYTLTETRPADGYALADEITFRLLQKVDEDGSNLQEAEAYYLTKKSLLFWTWDDWKLLDDATVIMRDDTIKAEFSKKDLTTMEELPGAELTITDKDGKEIDRWVSSDKPHYIEKLPAGDYTLTEVKAPDGYAFAESVPFTALPTGEVQQFEMLDDVIKVEISKKDLTTMEELPGAELTLTDKGGTVVEHWTSTDKPHYIEKLPAGDYTLTEVKAPDGYAFAESVPFTVLPTGEVQRFEMLDDVIKVEISKVDITTNKELPGAELIITNKDGKVVEHWTSTDKPHYIEKLPAGEYTLTEITAPNGYEIAEDIPFTVLPTGEVQRVVMKDAPIPEQPVQPTPPTTPTPTPLIPQTGDTFPLGLLLALAGLSLAGLAALIFKCVHCKAVAQKDDDETE